MSTYTLYNNICHNGATKQINGIKINAGSCIIDNLKITSAETELGNYNNTAQYPPKANTVSN